MGYLKFEKKDLINLELSLNKELLRTSRSGAYSCTTISGCNTRKYHGLLVCPIPNLNNELHVMLSALDETIIQHDAEFNLGLRKYNDDHYSPKGHKYIREFNLDNVSYMTYRVGGAILAKEKVFIAGEDRLLIRYTLLDAHSETKLRFKPFLAFRNVHNLTKANLEVSHNFKKGENGIAFQMYPAFPELFLQFSKQPEYVPIPEWNYNIEYFKEKARGYNYQEDLFSPGYFELPIKKGESIIFSAALEPTKTGGLKQKFTHQINKRLPRDSFFHCLENAAQQFYVRSEEGLSINAGFPWFSPRGRDTFIMLPGLKIVLGGSKDYEEAEKKIIADLTRYLEVGASPKNIQRFTAPDLPLWAIWAIQKITPSKKLIFERYQKLFSLYFNLIFNNRMPEVWLTDNGLLAVAGTKLPASWMNSMVQGTPSVPRTGYLVELNALWYNALKLYAANTSEKGELLDKINEQISKIDISFSETFVIPDADHLYDYVSDTHKSTEIRPNMLFVAALEYSPLPLSQQKKILDIVESDLLTPRGLRSLSPRETNYVGELSGHHELRDKHFHNGTAWPWLLGPFTDAYLKIYKNSGQNFLETLLEQFDEEMTHHCIGSISEYYDGNPPHTGRGGISFAMNVAELLRMGKLLGKL